MVKLVEVIDEEGAESNSPKDIVSSFLRSEMEIAKFNESEIGKSDKEVNNFMARMRVYLTYHKLDNMVTVSRQKPFIFIRRKEVKE